MKSKLIILFLVTVLFAVGGCKKDNLDPPESTLSGTVVIAGNKIPVGVRSNSVQLELWQRGYQLFEKIPVYINQDGTFSAKLFDGNYKLVRLGGAPWANNTDSIDIVLKGSANIDVSVTPYFTIGSETFTYNKADTSLTGVFSVSQGVAGRTVAKLSLNLGLTNFVDMNNQIPLTGNDINPPVNHLTTPTTIKLFLNPDRYTNADLKRQLGVAIQKGYLYARAGVQTTGVTERLYTQVKQISLK